MPQPPLPEFNEHDLVTALRQGRTEALSLLYDKYAPALLGLTTRMMRSQEEAERVLQLTFMAIWERRTEYDASCLSLLSWLILITRDTAVAALKASDKATRKDQPQSNGQAAKAVKESFYYLTPNEKAALDLVYLQGYTCAEAAAELQVAEEVLKTWLKAAGKHLREGKGE